MPADVGAKIELSGEKQYRQAVNNIIQSQKALSAEMKKTTAQFQADSNAQKKNAEQRRILSAQIESQNKKIDVLKDALQKSAATTGENSTATLKWKTQLENAEAELIKMQTQLQNLGTTDFQAKMKNLSDSLSDISGKMENVGKKMETVGTNMTKTVSAAVVGIGTLSMTAFNAVDAGADTITKLTGATGQELQDMQDSMSEIATTIPTSFDTVGNAIGEVNTRFGITGEELQSLSQQFVEFADLNDTDVTTAIDNAQKAMTAWGKSAEDVPGLLDIITRTSQKTGISADTLTQGLSQNATAFQELGMTVEQATAFLGQVEVSGADTSTVMQGLRRALKNAADEGKPLDEALAELQDTIKNGTGSVDGLSAAYDLFGKTGDQIYKAVQNGTIDFENLASQEELLADATGTVQKTYEATLDPIDQVKTVMNQLKLIGADIAAAIMPQIQKALTKVSEKLKEAKAWWEGLSEAQQDNIIKAAEIAAVLGPVISIIGKVTTKVGGALQGISKLAAGIGNATKAIGAGTSALGQAGTALGGISAATAGIGAAIGVAIAAFVHLWQTNDEFREHLTQTWENIKTTVQEATAGISERLQELGINWESITETLKTIWEGFCQILAPVFTGAFDAIAAVLQTVLDVLTGLLDVFIGVFTGDWEQAWNGVKEIFGGIWDGITEILTAAFDVIKGVTDTVLGWFGTSWNEVWNGVKNKVSEVTENVKTTMSNAWNNIKTVTESTWQGVQDSIQAHGGGIKGVVGTIIDGIKSIWSAGWKWIDNLTGGKLSGIVDKIKSFYSGIVDGVRNIIQGIKDAIKLPHFSISGKFSLNPISVPHLSVEWYKKAYSQAVAFKTPTVLATSAGLKGFGDGAGAEIAIGQNLLLDTITKAVERAQVTPTATPIVINQTINGDNLNAQEVASIAVDNIIAALGRRVTA